MSDFFAPMPTEEYALLLNMQVGRVKPFDQMTTIEQEEWKVLEAIHAAEIAKARLIYTRALGYAPREPA